MEFNKRLNERNREQEQLNGGITKAIEKEVSQYLSSIKDSERDQLSKPQMINSHKKTWAWLSKLKESNFTNPVIPKEFLSQDFDPLFYDPSNPNFTPDLPKINNMDSTKLLGEEFVTKILPNCVEEEDAKTKSIRMEDWLIQRQLKLKDQEKMKQWFTENNYKEELEFVEIWQQQHPERTVSEWNNIFSMVNNSLLSTNDLLRMYRSEVPPAARYESKYELNKIHSGQGNRTRRNFNPSFYSDREDRNYYKSGQDIRNDGQLT